MYNDDLDIFTDDYNSINNDSSFLNSSNTDQNLIPLDFPSSVFCHQSRQTYSKMNNEKTMNSSYLETVCKYLQGLLLKAYHYLESIRLKKG